MNEPSIDSTFSGKKAEELLPKEIVQLIKDFSLKAKGRYSAFDPQNPTEHYYDCTKYSDDLRKELLKSENFPNELVIGFLNVTRGMEKVKLFGEEVDFPSQSVHCALVIPQLNIVIEPQTGDIIYLSEAKDFYRKGLGLQNIAFLSTTSPQIDKATFFAKK